MKQMVKQNIAIYILLIILTIPFLVLAEIVKYQLLPGLPLSALAFLVPTLTVVIYYSFQKKQREIRIIPGFLFRINSQNPILVIFMVFSVMPFILFLSFFCDFLQGKSYYIDPINLSKIPILLSIFLISAFGEEFLWTGTFLKGCGSYFNWKSAIIIATAYIFWHLIPFLQTGNSISWIAEQMVFSFFFRILIMEIYYLTNLSSIVAIVLHSSYNLAWQLYPNSGSQYNPLNAAFFTLIFVILTEIIRRRKKHRQADLIIEK